MKEIQPIQMWQNGQFVEAIVSFINFENVFMLVRSIVRVN